MAKKQQPLVFAPPTKKLITTPTKEQIKALTNVFILAQKTQWAIDNTNLSFLKELAYFAKLFTNELNLLLNKFYNLGEGVTKEQLEGSQIEFFQILGIDEATFEAIYSLDVNKRAILLDTVKSIQEMPNEKTEYITHLLDALKNGEIEVRTEQ